MPRASWMTTTPGQRLSRALQPGDCESEGRASERGAACQLAHALAMQTPGQEAWPRGCSASSHVDIGPSRPQRGPHALKRPRSTSRALARSFSIPYWSMEGGSVDELLDVTVERPVLDQFQVEVGRALEDRVQPGLTGDDREERHLEAVD